MVWYRVKILKWVIINDITNIPRKNCTHAHVHTHTHTRHSLHKKLSWPSNLVNDHQIQHSISVLCKPDKCSSETVIRSDIHNNVSCCRLTSYNTPTYHIRDPKYCLPSQENPVWKNPWQVLIFCASGGHPNPHLPHAMGSVPQEGNSGLLKMKNNENKWY